MITTLDEFYAAEQDLERSLLEDGRQSEADRLEEAVAGGSTSGEILGRLMLELRQLADLSRGQDDAKRTLLAFIVNALGLPVEADGLQLDDPR